MIPADQLQPVRIVVLDSTEIYTFLLGAIMHFERFFRAQGRAFNLVVDHQVHPADAIEFISRHERFNIYMGRLSFPHFRGRGVDYPQASGASFVKAVSQRMETPPWAIFTHRSAHDEVLWAQELLQEECERGGDHFFIDIDAKTGPNPVVQVMERFRDCMRYTLNLSEARWH